MSIRPEHAIKDVSAEDDIVTFRFGPTFWTMRVNRLEPERAIEFESSDANQVHEGLPETIRREWVGPTLLWTRAPHGEGSRISVVHEGLVPTLGGYGICEAGWDHFFVNSLTTSLDKGAGVIPARWRGRIHGLRTLLG